MQSRMANNRNRQGGGEASAQQQQQPQQQAQQQGGENRQQQGILRLFQIFLDVFLEAVIAEFVTMRISRGTPSNGVPRFRYYQLSKPFFIVLLQEGMIIVSGRS